MTKAFVAIDLEDFHSRSKRWQGGKAGTVEIRVVGGKSLEQAKRMLKACYPGKAWYVFPLNKINNVVLLDKEYVR